VTRSWTVTLFRFEQPDEGAWRRLVEVAAVSNERGAARFEPLLDGGMWSAGFGAADREALDQLARELERAGRETGARYHLVGRNVIEEADYAAADFVELLGVVLDGGERPFVLNEEQALAPGTPCPVCGWGDAFDAVQLRPFMIDESRLDGKAIDGAVPGEGGWDVVTVANGHKLVSRRVASLLMKGHVRGIRLSEVIDGATGLPSERMLQLSARRAVLAPCPEHSVVHGDGFCPACGTARGDLEGWFFVRGDELAGDEAVSRHPGRGAMLYLARRPWEMLLAAGLNGVVRNDVMRICHHE
jgi:hypothetical protein